MSQAEQEGSSSQEGEGQEGTSTESETQQPQAGTESESGTQDDAELKRARSEAAKYRKSLREAQAQLEQLQNAGKSEEEQRNAELTKATSTIGELTNQVRRLTVENIAAKLDVVDPEDVARLLDWDELDDVDDRKAVERAIKALIKEKPYLAGQARPEGNADSRSRGGTPDGSDMNALLRQKAGYQ